MQIFAKIRILWREERVTIWACLWEYQSPPPPMELDKGAEVGLWPRLRETREKLSFLYFTMSLCKFCTTWKTNRKEIFKYWILLMVEFSVAVQLHLWLVRRMMIWYYSTFKNIYLALDTIVLKLGLHCRLFVTWILRLKKYMGDCISWSLCTKGGALKYLEVTIL